MSNTKYIIDEEGNFMIFSNTIHHSTAAAASRRHARCEPISAGFISVNAGLVSCWGLSESLGGLKSRGETDALIIANNLGLGLYSCPTRPTPQ